MANLNTKIGTRNNGESRLGEVGIEKKNERGEMLLNFSGK